MSFLPFLELKIVIKTAHKLCMPCMPVTTNITSFEHSRHLHKLYKYSLLTAFLLYVEKIYYTPKMCVNTSVRYGGTGNDSAYLKQLNNTEIPGESLNRTNIVNRKRLEMA